MSNRCISLCSGLLAVGLMLTAWSNASAVSVYYFYEGVMLDDDATGIVGFAQGSAFKAVYKFDDQDYLLTNSGGTEQHQYLRGVLPGQEGPDPGDAVPNDGPHGVGLVSVSLDLDNNGVVETTHLRTSAADNNGDTIDDGAPSSNGRIELKDSLIPGVDWFKWIGSAISRDVSVLAVPSSPGWMDLYPAGDEFTPPTNAEMTDMQTQMFNVGGLGILFGVGGGGSFFGDPGGVVTSFSVSSTIPEPTSMVLLGLGAAFCMARRRRC